ncbi:MAG: FAD-binding oxidoreductase [Deltaproteobacteria bacterium]|nr:FAD-binding oxidoreductase [Deltaproteobacteria bacterium]
MSHLTETQRTDLVRMFGPRANFDSTERMLYGHDIGDIPKLVKPFIGDTTPDAIVQPQSEQEVVELVRWAAAHKTALTPRGKATSGYGGVVPTHHGLVVDFFRMKSVVAVDPEGLTATVEPGISWEQLDRMLTPQGLTLRLYPSSYPSSTVGGWLAQGGAGYGSYEYGYFRDSVVSARAVLPSGEVREFSGADLDLVSEAEGITGLLTRVTVRLQPLEALDVVAVSCAAASDVQRLLQALADAKLPIWSASFINPKMAAMRNRAPLMKVGSHAVGERVVLPEAYILTLATRARDAAAVRAALPKLTADVGGEVLSAAVADHEWQERFNVMVIKRLGPSLIPSEVVVPLESLAAFLDEVGEKIAPPVVKEGLVLREGRDGKLEVVILGFIPGDQRKLSYNLVFGLALSIMKIAESLGGRAYSTGLYFARKAEEVLGAERLRKLQAFKEAVDPLGILNPKKVLDNGMLGAALQLAATTEPIVRRSGNLPKTEVGERFAKDVRDIPADVGWYAYSCSQCGYCVDTCEQFTGRGWESQSPRGKFYWLREYMEGRAEWDQKMVDTFLVCTTCEVCDHRCSEHMPVEPSWMKMRGKLINEQKRMTFPPFEMMAAALHAEGNIWAGYRKDRAAWFPEDLKAKHGPGVAAKNVYFAGCTASYVENDIAIASVHLLDAAGVEFTYVGEKESCCATPILVAGKWDLFAETMKKNIAAVKESGADTVITSCPACGLMWAKVYPEWCEKLGIEYGIQAKHYSEVVSEKLRSGEFRFPEPEAGATPCKVAWHDSCHAGRAQGIYEPPRELLQAIPGVELVEMDHNREEGYCCGSVLTLIHEPEVAADLGKLRLDEAVAVGADKLAALCPCCEFQLRVSVDARAVPMEVVDLASLAARSLGIELPDPHHECRSNWAVFDKMITLMTPKGFASLMGTMWPELMDAMPLGMGAMMRQMAKVPGALEAMKPLFPVLFPRLLPLMMPKVMPIMVERIRTLIPIMPDYMSEQLPDLLPKVMDNLMPHMIGDVVPLVTQPMIDYLKGEDRRAA